MCLVSRLVERERFRVDFRWRDSEIAHRSLWFTEAGDQPFFFFPPKYNIQWYLGEGECQIVPLAVVVAGICALHALTAPIGHTGALCLILLGGDGDDVQ